ncbi:MAG: RNA-binding domain-containing protein [Vampirovibrionales bacterium]
MMRLFQELTEHEKQFYIDTCQHLLKLGTESNFCEFKTNLNDGTKIGQTISALSNAVALHPERPKAYMIWGVSDEGKLVGTKFDPTKTKPLLEPWLNSLLSPPLSYTFTEVYCDQDRLILLEVEPAQTSPTLFKGTSYIKIGTANKPLNEFSVQEKALWEALKTTPFELRIAKPMVNAKDIAQYLDLDKYFERRKCPLVPSLTERLSYLEADRLIKKVNADTYHILNLGALLFAKDLENFDSLARKKIRLLVYEGDNNLHAQTDIIIDSGYALASEKLMNYLEMLPARERIESIFRKTLKYPEIALRELAINALLHQDFTIQAIAPKIEVFNHRIEFTNAGSPLEPDCERLVDRAAMSRNEKLVDMARKIGLCEDRGVGLDRVVHETEIHQLPAPVFYAEPHRYTKVTLYSYKDFRTLSSKEKINICYYHAVISLLQGSEMTNTSLRERFGLASRYSSTVSRVIQQAMKDKKIAIKDHSVGKRAKSYLPYFAVQPS